ncbi:ABC transporter substrate-binding protein [Kutzneria albida]|uniref:Leucine-binding protein domain-containing protein n=1 Tax=Kutzneria albida DSM 43870 TaxID=1449976 RepID=W5VXZ3_9PSEU|nr:ABC transporter substrate-binding protein [Kutzneria albida]AHH93437.1 hypothetical protein KALB_60 [Kutzneria albida DSM 43870]
MNQNPIIPVPKSLLSKALRTIALVLPVVLVFGVGGYLWFTRGHCADGVDAASTGECVGVTDGSYHFSEDLAEVSDLILKQNKEVLASGKPYVSIAVMQPTLPTDQDSSTPVAVRHELQGAALAQVVANTSGSLPRIRILIANTGSRSDQWRPVVEDLKRRAVGEDHLVAVSGLGQSLTSTHDAVLSLSQAHIPSVGSRITADNFSGIPGLVRIAPSNSDQVKAVVAYLHQSTTQAMLVQDVNATDNYSATIASAFAANFPDAEHRLVGQTEKFDSSLSGVVNTFQQMLSDICYNSPDAIFFAGRGKALGDFVSRLSGRQCTGKHLTVVAGDDTTNLTDPGEQFRQGLATNVTLLYTGLAHPATWTTRPDAVQSQAAAVFRGCRDTCYGSLFQADRDSLDDGVAIMAYDAVATVVKATQLIANQGGLSVGPADVEQEWNRLHDSQAVPGASGWISLDNSGNPIAKAVPILRRDPTGKVDFVQLSSARSGQPMTPGR